MVSKVMNPDDGDNEKKKEGPEGQEKPEKKPE
jgi:hypothetical protein